VDFSCFFEQWYYGEGFPTFRLNWKQAGDSLYLISQQSSSAPETTPLFQVPFEIEIRLADGSLERARFFQETNEQSFTLPVGEIVTDIQFDPDNWLLATSSVIQDWPEESAFRFGPNPFSSELYIQVLHSGPFDEVRITSITGEEVLILSQVDNPVTMDLSRLSDGPYFLELTNSSGTFLERIVKVSANLP
jgi:hypothetical protein